MAISDYELIISGDGKSAESAIVFKPCHIRVRIARERKFIEDQFGVQNVDWEEEFHFTSSDRHSVWVIKPIGGERQNVYFDTSQTIYDNE